VTVPEAVCYPRPIQDRIPIVVGGGGERRTLRLAARHADACNVFGEPAGIRHKVEVLHRHCEAEGRDPAAVTVTHLSAAEVLPEGGERTWDGAGTVVEQIGRYRAVADAGVDEVFVGLDAAAPGELERFAAVIAAFRQG
jgi:alkanesulfonate monooxygenase SsuD/methylene tetrahydromethanopterin reductase-like flavin-dependent oxidoreductase (luciferase family)